MSYIVDSLNLGETAWFLIRFSLNLITLFVLVKLLYYDYRKEGVPEYLFAFFLLGIIVFLICTALEMVEVQLGFALGLFALFGILRFRTESIPVREMTYLFMVIGIAMLNSLVNFQNIFNGIILSNTLIVIPTWLLEAYLNKNNYRKKEITIPISDDGIESDEKVREKIQTMTGYIIRRFKITKVNLVSKQCTIVIYYKA